MVEFNPNTNQPQNVNPAANAGGSKTSSLTSAQINAMYEAWFATYEDMCSGGTSYSGLMASQMVSGLTDLYTAMGWATTPPSAGSPLYQVYEDLNAPSGLGPTMIELLNDVKNGTGGLTIASLENAVVWGPLHQIGEDLQSAISGTPSGTYSGNLNSTQSTTLELALMNLCNNCNLLTGNPTNDQAILSRIVSEVNTIETTLTGQGAPSPLDGLCQALLNILNAPTDFPSTPGQSILQMCTSTPPDYADLDKVLSDSVDGRGGAILQRLFQDMQNLGEFT